MVPTRRRFVRAGGLALAALAAGCADTGTDDADTGTPGDDTPTATPSPEATEAETSTDAPEEETEAEPTDEEEETPKDPDRAAETPEWAATLLHDDPLLAADDLAGERPWYRTHLLTAEDAEEGAVADAFRFDEVGADAEAMASFVAETDPEATALLVVQARVSPRNPGGYLDWERADAFAADSLARATLTCDAPVPRPGEGSIATAAVRIPHDGDPPTDAGATLLFRGYFDRPRPTVAPPAERRYAHLNFETPGVLDGRAALFGRRIDAVSLTERLREEHSDRADAAVEFVEETEFGSQYLLAAETSTERRSRLAVHPRLIARADGEVRAELAADPVSGPRVSGEYLTLVRVDREAPDGGLVTFQRRAKDGEELVTEWEASV